MKTLLTALAALVLAAPALAAPPPNDNRADAQLLPTFPATAHGTTVEATVERLDPQVSKCGRVDATVWYRIDAAPDGTIVATTQAAGQLAPVVRIYRRHPSRIEEVACGTAKAAGKVVTSVGTVRGGGYLILVGRRAGTPDGEFDLQTELVLPPGNDERGEATPLGRLPATVRGTTLGATADSFRGCGIAGGGLWYRFKGPSTGQALVQLTAGQRDAAILAFRRSRSELEPIECAATDRNGKAVLGFATAARREYLLLIGDRAGSAPGEFALTVRAGEAPERLPGRALPRGGVRASVNGLTDVNDVWSVRLRRGTTYRIAFSSSPCAYASLRARSTTVRLGCRAYTSFTPGRDGGGRYTLEVKASPGAQRQRYQLRIAAAAADDLGVGVELPADSTARGRLSPNGVDVVDLYHFDVARTSEVRLGLGRPAASRFSLVLLTDSGTMLGSTESTLRRRLNRGRYVVAVGAEPGTRAGRYRLSLLLRDVTSTSVLISGARSAEVAPGSSVSLQCLVSPSPSGGLVELQIDRFDPLTGWHFHRVLRMSATAAVSWRPPAAGRWRVRARFLGTGQSAPSRSGYAYLTVARPIQ
jgi:hypothetical protein